MRDRRILGWYFFDWAAQPYHTVLLTFVFGPFFAQIASQYFAGTGLEDQAADARAQSLWSACLTISGLIVGIGAPVIGAFADTTGRRMPWIAVFSIFYVFGAASLWTTQPDGSNLWTALVLFSVGFVAAEYAQIFVNAQLPGLAARSEVGRVSGSGFAFGYLGGLIALVFALLLLVEQANGLTLAKLVPGFGLMDPETMQGTRATGPFVALWFAVFMVPFFLWVREPARAARLSFRSALSRLTASFKELPGRPSLFSFLGGSMFYRDALNGLYSFGGTYALLALDWEITRIGVFGIVSVIAAAVFSWIGGRLDRRFGPKPVVIVTILGLIAVCVTVANMSREAVFGMTLETGSTLPDRIFLVCGILIGGFGGTLQAASRSLMVRHTEPGAETSGFGLYGLTGRATSFLAPALIGAATAITGDVRNGVMPLIGLFLVGLLLLRWTRADGDRAEKWVETSSAPS